MLDIANLQKNVGEWQRKRQTIEEGVWRPVGRLLNSAGTLYYQAVTHKDDDDHLKRLAVGEIMIHLADYCDRENINMEHAVASTLWQMQLMDRDAST